MENQKRLIVTKKWTYLLLATIPLGIIKFIYDYTQYFITSKIGFAQFGYETFVSILIILIDVYKRQLYLLMDASTFETFKSKLATGGIAGTDIETWLAANGSSAPVFVKGDSLSELAKVIGMDAAVLENCLLYTSILHFTNLENVDDIYYEKNYYAIPEKHAEKAYELLYEAMRKQGVVAIAKTVISTKETLLALCPQNDGLLVKTLFYQEEIAPLPKDILHPKILSLIHISMSAAGRAKFR